MITSPSRHSGVNSEIMMNGVEAEAGGSSSTLAVATSSPSFHNVMIPSPSNQQFSIESFDFGADFSLPTSLDELTLFHQQHQQQQQQGSTNSSQSTGQPRSDGMTNSPRNLNVSARHMTGEQQHLQVGNSSQSDSPHTFSTRNDDVGAGSSASSTGNLNNVDLHNLLRAVQASSLSGSALVQQPVHPSQTLARDLETGANLSLSDMESYLLEKEQAERTQIQQTALLRQQLVSLQRQQSTQSTDASQSSVFPNASQIMQQFQHLTSQQAASTPTPQNMHSAAPFHQQSQHESSAFHQQSKVNLSSLSQYGLVTPLSSNSFMHVNQGALPFVSPINMPSSSQAGFMDGHRSYDPSYTPLESPAITPASVFSMIGSGNTTANSQDLFSPLTSPALRPQVGSVSEELVLPLASPFLGPNMSRGQVRRRGSKDSPLAGSSLGKKATTTPSASPAIVPTKSVPRKNRSTTAEARANRARPSPLIKPTAATMAMSASSSRKRGESSVSTGGLASPLAMAITNGASSPKKANHSRKSSQSEASRAQTTFPPLHASITSSKSLVASPSEEGASTTPSPIDLDANANSKPMTPGSIMGIDARNPQKGKGRNSETGKQVSFATGQVSASPGPLQTILPGEASSADRDAWLSTKSASGSSGGGLDSRRSSHKAAEQKRRDSLKYCFDELRGMLPAITLDDDAPGGSSLGPDGFLEDQEEEEFNIDEVGDEESARLANRAISKVALLRHSNEYLIRLKQRLARRDRDLDFCRKQVLELRSQLGYPIESQEGGILAQYLQSFTNGISFAAHNGHQEYTQMDIS